jgi:hypothetical protein
MAQIPIAKVGQLIIYEEIKKTMFNEVLYICANAVYIDGL